jgi:hypothetical protein
MWCTGYVPGCDLYLGLASWATLSRPFGTQFVSRAFTQNALAARRHTSRVPGTFLDVIFYPGLASWATLSRPFGTQFVSRAFT